MVFFLGAGASRPAPSCLPQPPEIQAAILEEVAPTGAGTAQDKQLIAHALPELYHEILLHLGDGDTREIWRVLSLWETAPELTRHHLGPNLIHLSTVYLAWRSRTPLITVNFDQMLERAAEHLGLEAWTSFDAVTDDDGVAIWKLHGSIDDPSSIRTTLQSITASHPEQLAKVRSELGRAQGCLIGYSGRDIDFFPFLCQWAEAHPVLWINLDFRNTAAERFGQPFEILETDALDWAGQVIADLPALDPEALKLKTGLGQPLPDERRVHDEYQRLIRVAAERLYRPMFRNKETTRLLVHALALAQIGDYHRASLWLDRLLAASPPAQVEARARLLEASLAHEGSRYLSSARAAGRAEELAAQTGSEELVAQAILSSDEAARMAQSARFVGIESRLGREMRRAFQRMLAHAWEFRRLRHPGPWQNSARPDYDRVRSSFAYLEHLVRVGAVIQGVLERRRVTRPAIRLLRPYWRWIERTSHRIGYAHGIGNAKKFMLRSVSGSRRDRDALSAFNIYALVSAATGLAIDRRDRAAVTCRAAMKLGPGPQREQLLTEACRLYDEADRLAANAGNASLQLKVMVGRKQADPSYRPDRDEVESLFDQVEGPAYDRIRDPVINLLMA
jgi:hypothetical protein